MTIEDCRVILKVHILAAEQSGKYAIALALTEVLDAIDAHAAQEKLINYLDNKGYKRIQ